MLRLNESVCPFCGLLCDDLTVEMVDQHLSVNSTDCHIAQENYQKAAKRLHLSAEISGSQVSYQRALEEIAALIQNSNAPLITGMETDVAGCRAALALADRIGAIINHVHNQAYHVVLNRLQTYGGYLTTLSEIKSRADLIIFAGDQIFSQFPRLIDKLNLDHPSSIHKKVISIGTEPLHLTNGFSCAYRHFSCRTKNLEQLLSLLRAEFETRNSIVPTSEHISKKDVDDIVHMIKNANYTAIVWATAHFDFVLGEFTIDAIFRLIEAVNARNRCAGLSLASSASTATVNQVSTWQCGKPLPLNFRTRTPEYHPTYYAYETVQEQNDFDLIIQIGGLDQYSSINVKQSDASIAITSSNLGNASVFVPVGIPGIHHNTHLFRTDNAVSLYQSAILKDSLLSSAQVIQDVLKQLRT